jgi:hypothetical protein
MVAADAFEAFFQLDDVLTDVAHMHHPLALALLTSARETCAPPLSLELDVGSGTN